MRPYNPTDTVPIDEAIDERRLLNKLQLLSFTATPDNIEAFQQSTLAWNVLVPADVTSEIDVRFTIGNAEVANPGSRQVAPLATGAFQLVAHSPLTSRVLGSKIVHVDTSDCQELPFPRATIRHASQQAKDLFVVGALSSRGDLDVEMLPPDGFRLEVPLKAAIENFYDADIDVDLDIRLSVVTQNGGNRVVAARLADVSVDVIFHLAEHIFSGGAATAAQALVQPLAEDLITGFLGPQLEKVVAKPLQEAIDVFLDLWRANDPDKRTYRLYSITAYDTGLVVLGCPVPKTTTPPTGPNRPPVGTTTTLARKRKKPATSKPRPR